jgi:methyltransferase
VVSTRILYALLVLAVGAERIVEIGIARRNFARQLARGGREHGREHFPAMAVMHAAFLLSCVAEVWIFDRPFHPWLAVCAGTVVIAAQALRYWCVTTLGERWTVRVVVVPGMELATNGPYRWLRHPNYVAVVAEIIGLPLVHTAYVTAVVFSLLNAAMLAVRIRVEERALGRTS